MLGNWHFQFPNCEPISHRMRTAFHTRCVRFHSLPCSKRYAEDEAEYRILLNRHNQILGELIDREQRVVLLTTGHSETSDVVFPEPELRMLDPNAKLWRSVWMGDQVGFAEQTYWHVFASERQWRPGLLDSIIRLVADWAVVNIMVVDPECSWLFCPYDGGMDVILESAAARDWLRSSHSDWLSPRADGL
jgi:hypothetical protein